jgi:hypothetical protein
VTVERQISRPLRLPTFPKLGGVDNESIGSTHLSRFSFLACLIMYGSSAMGSTVAQGAEPLFRLRPECGWKSWC